MTVFAPLAMYDNKLYGTLKTAAVDQLYYQKCYVVRYCRKMGLSKNSPEPEVISVHVHRHIKGSSQVRDAENDNCNVNSLYNYDYILDALFCVSLCLIPHKTIKIVHFYLILVCYTYVHV